MNFTFCINVSRNGCQSPLSSSLAENEKIGKQEEAHSYQSCVMSAPKLSNFFDNFTVKEQKIVKLMREKPKGYLEDLQEEINKADFVNLFIQSKDFRYKQNLLFHASREKCLEAVGFLLKKGADPTLANDKGTTVLHLMAKRGQIKMAKQCLSNIEDEEKNKVAFINCCEESGWTALMSAVENDQYDFAEWLISEKAAVNHQMTTGWTALHTAGKKGNWNMVLLLLNNGANRNLEACKRNYVGKVKPKDVTCNRFVHDLLE